MKILTYSILISVAFLLLSCGEDEPEITKSSAKEITEFLADGISGEIDDSAKSISLKMRHGTDISVLTPYIKVSSKASISPASNTMQDFTNPVKYTVTAEDGSTVDYTASAIVLDCVFDNISEFGFNGKNYEIIKENATWLEAQSCANERGGYLAEINSEGENNAIFSALNNADITLKSTVSEDGGGASYIWIGGNDLDDEGKWFWAHSNTQHWEGDANGSPVNGLYNNWGTEPDNFANQDCLGIAITQWPLGSGSLGSPGQWNDLKKNNMLYYVIEYD